MKDLFYSVSEGLLFYVAGYADSTNVMTQISMLQNNYNHMKRISGGETQISSEEILKSSRYKSMRVFWCKTTVIPQDAFVIGDKPNDPNNWTMWKWINN